MATVGDTGERFWLAELHRLSGELELIGGNSEARERAERAFGLAIETARAHGARSLELRAATSLGRILSANGKRMDAHDHLSTAYSHFTDGFETPDLRNARALLQQWAS